jgi:hypothetical protein
LVLLLPFPFLSIVVVFFGNKVLAGSQPVPSHSLSLSLVVNKPNGMIPGADLPPTTYIITIPFIFHLQLECKLTT